MDDIAAIRFVAAISACSMISGVSERIVSVGLKREIDDLDGEFKPVALRWYGLYRFGFALIVGEGLS